MTPGSAAAELEKKYTPDEDICRPGLRLSEHIKNAPFRIKGFAVDDAATGERLAGPFLTEVKAEKVLKRERKKHPSAFVKGGAS